MIESRFIPKNWTKPVKPVRDPNVLGKKSYKWNVARVIILHIHTGDLLARAWFGVVGNSSMKLFLGTSFIDRFDKCIVTEEHMVVPKNSKQVVILDTN